MVKNKFLKVLTFSLAFLILGAFFAPKVGATYYKKQAFARFTAVAGEAISAGEVLALKDSDGEAYLADSDDSAVRAAIGVAGADAADGAAVEIVAIGIFDGWSSLAENGVVYLHTTAGEVSQTAGTYAQKVGVAINTTQIYFNFEQTTNNITTLGTLTTGVTLDDGATNSPALTLTDETNETCAILKLDNGDTTVTIPADTDFEIVTGNLAVGDGTPGTASMDGEDAYINGQLEVDGAVQLDGALTAASTVTIGNNVLIDDSATDSPSLTFTDETGESAVILKDDDECLTITTVAADGVQILTGNLRVGNGTANVITVNGEDLYVEDDVEIDGTLVVDTDLDVNGTANISGATVLVGNVLLDDSSTNSPSLTLTDETAESCVIVKVDNGDTTVTIPSDTDFEIVTGNLAVGDGTPGTAAMDGEDLYVNGDVEIDGTVQLDGALTCASTTLMENNVLLDDSVTDSPSLTLTDATGESAVILKDDGECLTITTVAADGVQILTGNLKVGNGTPSQTINGEDMYVEGLVEIKEGLFLDDGTGASPSLTFIDATDETAVFSKEDSGELSITTEAADGLQVLVGNLRVGDGTPVQTIDGEDLYCEGLVEIAGVLYPSGGIQFEGTDNAFEVTLAATDAIADSTATFPNYTGDVPVVIAQDLADKDGSGATVDGISVTVPAGQMLAGTALRFTVAGTCTGTNDTKTLTLYIDNADIVTLTTAAGDVGDWHATFIMGQVTDLAHQRCVGTLTMGDTIYHQTDYGEDTSDFSGAIVVKVRVATVNAGDHLIEKLGIVEFLP